jgi:hypothetical protein
MSKRAWMPVANTGFKYTGDNKAATLYNFTVRYYFPVSILDIIVNTSVNEINLPTLQTWVKLNF